MSYAACRDTAAWQLIPKQLGRSLSSCDLLLHSPLASPVVPFVDALEFSIQSDVLAPATGPTLLKLVELDNAECPSLVSARCLVKAIDLGAERGLHRHEHVSDSLCTLQVWQGRCAVFHQHEDCDH